MTSEHIRLPLYREGDATGLPALPSESCGIWKFIPSPLNRSFSSKSSPHCCALGHLSACPALLAGPFLRVIHRADLQFTSGCPLEDFSGERRLQRTRSITSMSSTRKEPRCPEPISLHPDDHSHVEQQSSIETGKAAVREDAPKWEAGRKSKGAK